MSNFERGRRIDTVLSQPTHSLEPTHSESSFSAIVPFNEPSYATPPPPDFLTPDHPQILCLNSIAQSKYDLESHQIITSNCPLLAQNVAVDLAKAQLFSDPELMHKRLIKLHNVQTNLKIDLQKIITDLEQIPTFHSYRHRSLREWFRKSRIMIFGIFLGLLLSILTSVMMYIVIKLRLILRIFG